jgi:hypothetical protein
MHAIDDFIIVGVYSGERREEEYTKPGCEAYARSMVEELSVAMDWTQDLFFGREIEQTITARDIEATAEQIGRVRTRRRVISQSFQSQALVANRANTYAVR